jgi:hypothetical protein
MFFQILSSEPNQPSVVQHMPVIEQANTPKAAFLTVSPKEGDDVQTLLETRTDIQRKKIDELTMDSSKEGPGSQYTFASANGVVRAMTDTLPAGQRGIKREKRKVLQLEQRAKDLESSSDLYKIQLKKDPMFEFERPICSKEHGDMPDAHDSLFNFIPGSCFEVGAALCILDQPGRAGEVMDSYALQLADFIQQVYTNPGIGGQTVLYRGEEITLRDLVNARILQELSPTSDQLGRCLDPSKKEEWFKGEGKDWLLARLRVSTHSEGYEYTNMLTKIRAISAFGTIMRELVPANAATLAPLFGQSEDILQERCKRMLTQIRHEKFDDPVTRARSERRPRQEQVIENLTRPGILTEYAAQHIPSSFKEVGLPELLESKVYHHGTGINRWQLKGTYPRESWAHEMPVAGAHSGGTVDTLFGLDCMSKNSIFGNAEIAIPAGLLISSFMNFGGYHSFVESFPIAQAVAEDREFVVHVDADTKRTLYRDFLATTASYAGEIAGKQAMKYHDAYKESLPSHRKKSLHNPPKLKKL